VVIDEFGEGIPVAWMISNREDTLTIVEFLQAMKSRTGTIVANHIMTDDAPQFYNAWVSVFGKHNTQKLLCAWHVDRAWRSALRETTKNTTHQMEIYHHLQSLLHEIEEGKFRATLQRFLALIQHLSNSFLTYFKTNYCGRIEQWASFNRLRANINTNMFLESFHRVLKVIYLNHKQNRRIDTLLTTLLKVSRDKAFERFRKLEVGKSTHRLCEINKRHKTAQDWMKNEPFSIIELNNNKWRISSQHTPSMMYTVTLNVSDCSCQLRCKLCNICVHQSSCDCIDSVLHSTICKHIHLICMKYLIPAGGTHSNPAPKLPQPDDSREYFSALLAPEISSTIMTARNQFRCQVDNLLQEISHCTDATTVNTATRQLIVITQTVTASKLVGKRLLPPKHKYSPNINHITQQVFHSTKKKRKKLCLSIAKPNPQQLTASKAKLSRQEPDICAICWKVNDIDLTYSQINVLWVQCSNCKVWVHKQCLKLDEDESLPEQFFCSFCCKTLDNN